MLSIKVDKANQRSVKLMERVEQRHFKFFNLTNLVRFATAKPFGNYEGMVELSLKILYKGHPPDNN